MHVLFKGHCDWQLKTQTEMQAYIWGVHEVNSTLQLDQKTKQKQDIIALFPPFHF